MDIPFFPSSFRQRRKIGGGGGDNYEETFGRSLKKNHPAVLMYYTSTRDTTYIQRITHRHTSVMGGRQQYRYYNNAT